MIQLEDYKHRKRKGLTNYDFDSRWDTTRGLEKAIKNIVNIMLDELNAQTSEKGAFISVTVGDKGFEFMHSLFKVRYANIPVNPDETPFYNVSVLLHKYSSLDYTYKFDEGKTSQDTVDALALLIDKLKHEVIKTADQWREGFLVEEYLWDVIEKYKDCPTAEKYRLKKTLAGQFRREAEIWREKRRAYNAQYQDTIERLFKIKNQLPHSVNILKSYGGRIIKQGTKYRAVLHLEDGKVIKSMLEPSPYVAAKFLIKDLKEEQKARLVS